MPNHFECSFRCTLYDFLRVYSWLGFHWTFCCTWQYRRLRASTDKQKDATKHIISPASLSIRIRCKSFLHIPFRVKVYDLGRWAHFNVKLLHSYVRQILKKPHNWFKMLLVTRGKQTSCTEHVLLGTECMLLFVALPNSCALVWFLTCAKSFLPWISHPFWKFAIDTFLHARTWSFHDFMTPMDP